MRAGRVFLAALCVSVVAPLLGGCSQLAALAPVGGDGLAEVRYGAIDVLLGGGIDILQAPVCTAPGDAITCTGTTTEGDAISVTSSSAADASLTVEVGSRQLYDGPLQTVLDEAARP